MLPAPHHSVPGYVKPLFDLFFRSSPLGHGCVGALCGLGSTRGSDLCVNCRQVAKASSMRTKRLFCALKRSLWKSCCVSPSLHRCRNDLTCNLSTIMEQSTRSPRVSTTERTDRRPSETWYKASIPPASIDIFAQRVRFTVNQASLLSFSAPWASFRSFPLTTFLSWYDRKTKRTHNIAAGGPSAPRALQTAPRLSGGSSDQPLFKAAW